MIKINIIEFCDGVVFQRRSNGTTSDSCILILQNGCTENFERSKTFPQNENKGRIPAVQQVSLSDEFMNVKYAKWYFLQSKTSYQHIFLSRAKSVGRPVGKFSNNEFCRTHENSLMKTMAFSQCFLLQNQVKFFIMMFIFKNYSKAMLSCNIYWYTLE